MINSKLLKKVCKFVAIWLSCATALVVFLMFPTPVAIIGLVGFISVFLWDSIK